jgi:CheY-like chemotaxis protein
VRLLEDVRVLVVDDDDDSRDMIRVALESEGARATCVAGAREALAAFEREVPNIVVSDIAMPGGDGHDFLKRVRALPRRRGGRVPAVALTALTSREARLASRAAGFHYHLDKPVDVRKLVEILQSLVRLTGE